MSAEILAKLDSLKAGQDELKADVGSLKADVGKIGERLDLMASDLLGLRRTTTDSFEALLGPQPRRQTG